MKTNLLFIYTESPLHAGTGTGLASVDLPIQRERTTQYPNVQGSGIKGALRSQCGGNKDEINAVFGPDTDQAGDFAGAISMGEARIVLFPVRSLMGVFAYTTSPHVLARLFRDAHHAGLTDVPALPTLQEHECLTTSDDVVANDKVVLEEFSFQAVSNQLTIDIANWLAESALPQGTEYEYWRNMLRKNFVILSDNAFRDFVVNSTEVVTRVRIVPDSKTVQDGALWTQEALPADTLMVTTVMARKVRVNGNKRPTSLSEGTADEVLNWLRKNLPSRIQIGGDETTGAGQVSLRWF